mgnify:CR=1 FL=1
MAHFHSGLHDGPVLGEDKPRYVNRMFARIAERYDLMNVLMTFGQDQRWRRALLDACDLPPRGRLLDVGAGTGEIARQAAQRFPGAEVVAVDFTLEMMAVARAKRQRRPIPYVQGDTLALPFASHSFDAVVSGFLLRNVADRMAALREQARVVRPGGRVVCLETAPPQNVLMEPLFRLYFFGLIPRVGALVSGDAEAYAYLPHSTVDFPAPAALQREMELAGLHNVMYRTFMFGAVAIHWGEK